MNRQLQELLARIRELEQELDAELQENQAKFRYRINGRRINFEPKG